MRWNCFAITQCSTKRRGGSIRRLDLVGTGEFEQESRRALELIMSRWPGEEGGGVVEDSVRLFGRICLFAGTGDRAEMEKMFVRSSSRYLVAAKCENSIRNGGEKSTNCALFGSGIWWWVFFLSSLCCGMCEWISREGKTDPRGYRLGEGKLRFYLAIMDSGKILGRNVEA